MRWKLNRTGLNPNISNHKVFLLIKCFTFWKGMIVRLSSIILTLSLGRWTSRPPTPILWGAWSTLVSASVCLLHLSICGVPPVLWFPTSQIPGPGSHTVNAKDEMFHFRSWLHLLAFNNWKIYNYYCKENFLGSDFFWWEIWKIILCYDHYIL